MTLNPREQHHLDNAAYFTTVRGARPATREKRKHLTFDQARAYAESWGDKRTMIYAVSPSGSAHICNA